MRSFTLTLVTVAFVIVLSFIFFSAPVSAQGGTASEAPVLWERYRAANRKESVLLPKIPTVVHELSYCSDVQIDQYYAYANDAVYEFSVAYRGEPRNYLNCTPKHFGQAMFDERLETLRDPKQGNVESNVSANGAAGFKFSNSKISRWLFLDIKGHRWIELAIHHRPGAAIEDAKFADSLDLSGGQGKDIGEGSAETLGDTGVDVTILLPPVKPQDPKPIAGDPFWIIAKPKAPYTEQARKDNVQGSVTLKVVLLASGGIGSVTVVGKPLDDGLTDNAIAAARRVVFLPKKVNGVPVSTAITFQYGFNIY